jgi:hypothetical protein
MFVQATTMTPMRVSASAQADGIRARSALAAIEGSPFDVRTSAGQEPAARRIAQRALATHDFLDRVIGIAPRLSLRVLDRRDWLRYADDDWYGTPHVSHDGALVVGADPADEWGDVSDYLARRLPPRELARLVAVHGVDARNRRGPSLDALVEARVAYEVARLSITQQRVVFPSRWLEEAFASYVLVAVLGDTDPAGLRLIGSLAEAARALDGDMPTLSEFERGFGAVDAIAQLLGELAIARSVYTTYARSDTVPLAELWNGVRTSTDPDADWEFGRMLGPRIPASIAAIPDAFAVERMSLAA